MKYIITIESNEPIPGLIAWLRRRIRMELYFRKLTIRTERD